MMRPRKARRRRATRNRGRGDDQRQSVTIPGSRSAGPCGSLALLRHEKAGDHANSESAFLRQELELVEEPKSRPESPAVLAKVKPRKSFSSRSFVDFEDEHDLMPRSSKSELMGTIFMLRSPLANREKALAMWRG